MDVKPLNFFQLMKRVAIRKKETDRLFRTALDTGFYSDGWLLFALNDEEKKSLKEWN
jgi:hypothetical protein